MKKTWEHMVFLTGLHRSGTSMLHRMLCENTNVSGFTNTGVPEDEGQHLQSVVRPASFYGGPGRFAFKPDAYMDESHELVSTVSAKKILSEWGQYWNKSKSIFIEKSPPTIIRMRFFQALFPGCKFILLMRHPIPISYATRRWRKVPIKNLVTHVLCAYEIAFRDLEHIENSLIVRYEDLVSNPVQQLNRC